MAKIQDPLSWMKNKIRKHWRFYRNIFVTLFIIFWIVPTFQSWLSVTADFNFSIAYSLWFILLYLWILEKRSNDIYYNSQHTMTEASLLDILRNYLRDNGNHSKITLIMFSGISETGIIEDLFKNFKEVDIYLQNPDHAVKTWRSSEGKTEVEAFLTALYTTAQQHRDVELNIYLYPYRAAYKAVLVDDHFLILSWYTFQSLSNFPDHFDEEDDGTEEVIRGGGYPHAQFLSPSSDYNIAKSHFDKVSGYLKHDSKSLSRVELKDYIRKRNFDSNSVKNSLSLDADDTAGTLSLDAENERILSREEGGESA